MSAQKEMTVSHWNTAKFLEQTRIDRIYKKYGVRQSSARTMSSSNPNPSQKVNSTNKVS